MASKVILGAHSGVGWNPQLLCEWRCPKLRARAQVRGRRPVQGSRTPLVLAAHSDDVSVLMESRKWGLNRASKGWVGLSFGAL